MACVEKVFLALAALVAAAGCVPAAIPAKAFTQTTGMLDPVTIVVSPFTSTLSLMVLPGTETALPTTPWQSTSWTVITSTGLLTETIGAQTSTTEAHQAPPTSTAVVTSVVEVPETSTVPTTTPSPTPTRTPEPPKKKGECMELWSCCKGACLIGSFFTFGISCVACLAIHKDLK